VVLSDLFPRIVVIVLLYLGAIFTYFEGIYLHDQWVELGPDSSKILLWMWLFRLLTFAFAVLATAFLYFLVRRYFSTM